MNSFRLRMRRTLLLLAAMAMALVVASGIAWAATIQCPNQPEDFWDCLGTDEADVMYGTADEDHMGGLRGADTLYGRGGNDELVGGRGNDDVYGGGGDDQLSSDDSDVWNGADENYGGRGNDFILGGYGPELHSGGPGDDTIVDYKTPRIAYADVFRCGDGHDEVTYNEGDRVAADCEVVRIFDDGSPPSEVRG